MTTAVQRELPAPTPISGITTEIVRVSPTIAEKWLGKNVNNRHISEQVVARYKRAMLAGEWLITGEAVKFAVTGELLDGQHRLAAVIAADRTVPMMVVKGLPKSAQDVMDTGRARTIADQLSIAGFPNALLLAAVARTVILYESGRMTDRDRSVSTPLVHALVDGNTLIAYATARAAAIAKGSDLRASVAGACFYELMKVNDEKAQEFFDRLTDGANLPSGSPILALRARLRTLRDDRTYLPTEALVSLVFRAWNAWRQRRNLSTLPLYRNGELIPCPDPAK